MSLTLFVSCAQEGSKSATPSVAPAGIDQSPPGKKRLYVRVPEDNNGNMGGLAGADNLCMNSAAKPATGTYKAVVSGSSRRACLNPNCTTASENLNWVMKPLTTYYRADGVTLIGTTNAAGILAFPLPASINEMGYAMLTGLNGDWTTGQNCNDWTSAAGANPVTAGTADLSTGASLSDPNLVFLNCSFGTHMLCAEQ